MAIGPPAGGGFDNLAASIRADSRDLRTFLDVLADKLTTSLPGHVQVEREGGLFKKDHPVKRLTLTLDDRRYLLMWSNGSLVAEIDSVAASGVSGFRPFPLDEWVDRLTDDIARNAASAASARSAMDNLLEGKGKAVAIARPAGAAAAVVAQWPQQRITGGSTIEVGANEVAFVLLEQGLKGPYGPGETPVWKLVIEVSSADSLTDPEAAELSGRVLFVSTAEHPGQKFGGGVDKVEDPETGLAVGLRVFGDYTLQVADAAALVGKLAPAAPQLTDAALGDLVRDILLRSFRTEVVGHITAGSGGWHILGLSAHSDEIEQATLERAKAPLAEYGLQVTRIGNFVISMKDEDEKLLTDFRAKQAASNGGPQQHCPSCGAANPAGARFCSGCGKPLALACAACGAANQPGAKFCSNCGKPLEVAAGGSGG